jgi:hypothetical protein
VFVAAVAQAKDPHLPVEQRQWWYWSRLRKTRESSAERDRTAAAALGQRV